MSIHIIIDGYNLIRQSHTLSSIEYMDFQLGRDALINAVAEYKKIKHHKITLVFDGINSSGIPYYNDIINGIKIKFSRNGETADSLIKEMASKEREKALIVTSDLDIVRFAESCHSTVITSGEFEKKITLALLYGNKYSIDDEEESGWVPTTKKKGPKKKNSRKKRKLRIKAKKL